MLSCLLAMAVLGWADCEPPHVRPAMTELFAIDPGVPALYGPNPDCMNRDRHIRYLSSLKKLDVQEFDDILVYDQTIDAYVARLIHYCK